MVRPLVFSIALAIALGTVACSSAQMVPMVSGPQTPAAMGTVTFKPTENGNLEVSVSVRHLAYPERVAPGAVAYVVWIQPHGGAPQNVGALVVRDDLTGQLTTVTPHQAFELYITAENDPAASAPRGPRVLTSVISQ
ncbi:MAG: hypothetical protein R3B70_03170 [Polyangiaceae bacterium]